MPAVDAAPPIVDARGLCKDYGTRRVVTDVSFALARGECLGLLGPNGAGKTTTIRMVTCFTAPSAGTLAVLGMSTTPANHAAIKGGLGVGQQDESLDPDLSVEQNLIVYASYFGIARGAAVPRAEALMRFAELAEHRTARIRTLSGGMKRRLMLARALLNEPRLLVLDEPTTGLDPQARRLVWERIRTLKRQGTTILLTTHYMEEAAQLCDRTIIMDHGRIVAEGTPAERAAVGRRGCRPAPPAGLPQPPRLLGQPTEAGPCPRCAPSASGGGTWNRGSATRRPSSSPPSASRSSISSPSATASDASSPRSTGSPTRPSWRPG